MDLDETIEGWGAVFRFMSRRWSERTRRRYRSQFMTRGPMFLSVRRMIMFDDCLSWRSVLYWIRLRFLEKGVCREFVEMR